MHTINSYCTNHIISFSRLQSLFYLASFNQYDVSLSTPNHINYKHQGNSLSNIITNILFRNKYKNIQFLETQFPSLQRLITTGNERTSTQNYESAVYEDIGGTTLATRQLWPKESP